MCMYAYIHTDRHTCTHCRDIYLDMYIHQYLRVYMYMNMPTSLHIDVHHMQVQTHTHVKCAYARMHGAKMCKPT